MPDGDAYGSPVDVVPDDLAADLMARHVEVQTLAELLGTEHQRGTPIPALYNIFYKFIQNPSTVSVETFKRMIDTDETIGSGVDFLTSCLLARLGAYQHDDPIVTKFVKMAFEDVEGGFADACKDLLSASWAGFGVSETVWANKPQGFVPQKLVPLPPATILFETARTGEVTPDGILQYQRNYNPIGLANGASFFAGLMNASPGFIPNRPDPMAKFGDMPFPLRSANTFNYLSIRIPVVKCIHFAWNSQGRFGNPYGRSLLRRAYNWWVQKWAYCQMMGVGLDRKGTPLLVVFADPNATMQDARVYASGAKPDRNSSKRAPAAAAEAFRNIHNDTVVVLPGMKDKTFSVQPVDMTGSAADFIEAIRLCNTLMMRALLIPALIFTSGDGAGSYSLGQEHAKTFDKILDGYLEGFKRVLLDQLVKPILAFNFPKAVWTEKGLGGFARRELTVDERQKEAELFTVAIDKGIVDTDDLADLNKMREAMGFEPRDTPIPKKAPAFSPFGLGEELDENGQAVQPVDGEQAEGNAGGRPGALRPDGAGGGAASQGANGGGAQAADAR